ncbi:MAG: hypothetical protein SF052_09960 [Bacteroidia bacterium]|nr:hypothetical protein [Bacteroidia bacterium]
MKSEQEIYDLIEKYLKNELSLSEKTAFEARCKEDQVFADEVLVHTLAREEIRHASIVNLKKRLDERFENIRQPRVLDIRQPRFQWAAMAVAAAVVLMFLMPIFFPRLFAPTNEELYAMYVDTPDLQDETTRSTNGDNNDPAAEAVRNLWAEAIKAIKDKKPEEAVSLYTQIMQDSAMMSRAPSALNYQMGIALMLSDRHPEAITYFDQVLDINQKRMSDWYKALALVKTNRLDEASALLQTISEDQEQTIERRKEAKDLLRKVEKIKE